MSRAGRKRKVQRESAMRAGRDRRRELVREREPTRQEVARRMPHRRIVGDKDVHDPRCETPIGCLAVIGAIPDREYQRALNMQRIVLEFRTAIAAPGPVASIAGFGLPQASPGSEISPESSAARLAAYRDLKRAIDKCGNDAWKFAFPIIVEGQPVPAGGFPALMQVLRAIPD